MPYHVRITQASNRTHDELKLDLSREQLLELFVHPYQEGRPIVISGKVFPTDDIERIKINFTEEKSDALLPIIRSERARASAQSGVIVGIVDEWYVTKKGEDVTDEFITGPPGSEISKEVSARARPPIIQTEESEEFSNQIFIVHGHDDEMKQHVARIVLELGLEPIILHEQPNQGLTIIEKLVKHSAVTGYAVVLLSPDDYGLEKPDSPPENLSLDDFSTRARQNVILELGLFLGLLGRERVLPLHSMDENFELPSDFKGVIYIPYDEKGSWRLGLVKELRSLGYSVSADDLP